MNINIILFILLLLLIIYFIYDCFKDTTLNEYKSDCFKDTTLDEYKSDYIKYKDVLDFNNMYNKQEPVQQYQKSIGHIYTKKGYKLMSMDPNIKNELVNFWKKFQNNKMKRVVKPKCQKNVSFDEQEKIASGLHKLNVINKIRFAKRVTRKDKSK